MKANGQVHCTKYSCSNIIEIKLRKQQCYHICRLFCCILAVGCIYIDAVNAMGMSMNEN